MIDYTLSPTPQLASAVDELLTLGALRPAQTRAVEFALSVLGNPYRTVQDLSASLAGLDAICAYSWATEPLLHRSAKPLPSSWPSSPS